MEKIPIKTSNPLCGLAMMQETPMPGGKVCLMSPVVGASVFVVLFKDAERKVGTLCVMPKDVAEQIRAATKPAMDDTEPAETEDTATA
jgi:hypothetical protein